MADLALPVFTDTVDQRWFIEPLNGPTPPGNYLDRFPDEVYSKSPDSHLVRFLYALLGPGGIGWLKKNLLDARLALEDSGFETFDIERYYADPFAFGRILAEIYDEDPTGLLPRDAWDKIKAQDEAYRARALNFFKGVRLGTSPAGLTLVATSGLGHAAEIVENYRYLFDLHSDHPLGLTYYGKTTSTEEFIVLPRQEVSQSEVHQVTFTGPPTSGQFAVVFGGRATPGLAYNAATADLQAALDALPNIGPGNTVVTGGPAPSVPFVITFTGALSNQALPDFGVIDALVGGRVTAEQIENALDPATEVVTISPELRHNLQVALDLIKPLASIPTLNDATGIRTPQSWTSVLASSEYQEVIRFVTGNPGVTWPAVDSTHWIVPHKELEAPRVQNDRQHHYVGFHNVFGTQAYTDAALSDPNYATDASVLANYNSEHIGPFAPQQAIIPFFRQYANSLLLLFTADRALADYAEPLTVTTQDDDSGDSFINGIYPVDYASLPGVPTIRYRDEQFWASRERLPGDTDYLEIDLGSVQAVNYLSFEIITKPVDISVAIDTLDQAPRRSFVAITPDPGLPSETSFFFDPAQFNPWSRVEYHFTDAFGDIPFTRLIRIGITRRATAVSPDAPPFLYDPVTEVQTPWSVEVKNLRIGRNVVG